jgi:hypothetical protein
MIRRAWYFCGFLWRKTGVGGVTIICGPRLAWEKACLVAEYKEAPQ